MPGPNWQEDDDTPELVANAVAVEASVVASALSGEPLTIELVCRWHVSLYAGIDMPSDQYRGNFRGSSLHSDLIDYTVKAYGILGTRPHLVYGEIRHLLVEWLPEQLSRLDELYENPSDDAAILGADMEVLRVAGVAHGEWVRIHPFANANGRTARLILLWICVRYGIPPLMRVRPRMSGDYENAAADSMTHVDHAPFVALLKALYAERAR